MQNASSPRPKWHHRGIWNVFRVIFIGWVPTKRHGVVRCLMWLAPFYIMAIGNACSQLLPAHWPALTPLSIWPWACLELLLMIAWLLYEIWFSANRDTPGSELQLDAAIDMTIALGLCVYAANRWGAGVSIGWWFYLPSVGAIVDAYQSALLGINNAMQKPGVSPKLGT